MPVVLYLTRLLHRIHFDANCILHLDFSHVGYLKEKEEIREWLLYGRQDSLDRAARVPNLRESIKTSFTGLRRFHTPLTLCFVALARPDNLP